MIKKILQILRDWWDELTGRVTYAPPREPINVIKGVSKQSLRGNNSKRKAVVGALIRKTAGGNHGWYESNVGLIRKPIQ